MAFVTESDFIALNVANGILGIGVLAAWVFIGAALMRGLMGAHRRHKRHM